MSFVAIITLEYNNYISFSIDMNLSLYNESREKYNAFITELYEKLSMTHDSNISKYGKVHEVSVFNCDVQLNERTNKVSFFVYKNESCANYLPVHKGHSISFIKDDESDNNGDCDGNDLINVTCKHLII